MQRIDSPSASGAELAATIADLAKLDGATLKAQSQTLYGSAPPRRITRGLLIRAVAYRLQEQGFS